MLFSNKNMFSVLALFLFLAMTTIGSPAHADRTAKKLEAVQSSSSDAYIWGYPAVLMKHTRDAMLGETKDPKNAVNRFFYSPKSPDKFLQSILMINSENLYSWAWMDLSEEPLIFSQPALADRYFSVQFVDAYTNVFQVISNESLDGKSATFAITSPTWKGDLPAGVVRLKASTPEVFAVAQSSSTKHDFQPQLIPLSQWSKGVREVTRREASPQKPLQVNTSLAGMGAGFLPELFDIAKKNPPPTSADAKQLQVFQKRFSEKLSAEQKSAIERGLYAGARKIEDRIASGFGAKVNGWSYEMRTEPFREDYLTRAAVAAVSLYSVPAQEYVHLKATADSEDRQLYSNYKYVMHFEKGELPPTPTSWTLRVFEAGTKSLARTPVERASLNDRRSALKYNDDGSMDIMLQEEAPAKDHQANWLPLSKEAGFFVMLTVYNPNNSVLNRKFVAPSITRVEENGFPRQRIVRTMMAKANVSQ